MHRHFICIYVNLLICVDEEEIDEEELITDIEKLASTL